MSTNAEPRLGRRRVERGIYEQPNGKYMACFMVDGKPRFRVVGLEARGVGPGCKARRGRGWGTSGMSRTAARVFGDTRVAGAPGHARESCAPT
jgi:hypothetical protein